MPACKLLIERDKLFHVFLCVNACLFHFNFFLQFFITRLGELGHYLSLFK